VGPSVAQGTLVLVSGRRALIDPQGAMLVEKVPSPEPLEELLLVPTAAGLRLIGLSPQALYRIDDPLGAPTLLARTRDRIRRAGAGPGFVAMWTSGYERPIFVDVETGKTRAVAGLPTLPLQAIAFLDLNQGAAVFEAAGLAVTRDGGASWAIAAAPDSTSRMLGLRRRGDALRAFTYNYDRWERDTRRKSYDPSLELIGAGREVQRYLAAMWPGDALRSTTYDDEEPDAAIDVAGARVLRQESPRVAANEPPLRRWLRFTGSDPLMLAARSGVELPSGGALVARNGLLGRVDLRTGALTELGEFANNPSPSACAIGRVGPSAWVACSLTEYPKIDEPFGVFRVPLDGPKLVAEPPVLVQSREHEFIASPSGGAMLVSPCAPEGSDDDVCVRGPDGAWRPVRVGVTDGRGIGPLADGRVAILRGLDGDEDEDSGEAASAPQPIQVVLIDQAHNEQVLPPITIPISQEHLMVQSGIQEGPDHVLHFVLGNNDSALAVAQPIARGSAVVQTIPGARVARIHAGRGLAFGPGHVLASIDGGNIWSEIPGPRWALELPPVLEVGSSGLTLIQVSEIGATIGGVVRLGWGPAEAAPEAPRRIEGPLLAPPEAPPPGPEMRLECKSAGSVVGGLPPFYPSQTGMLQADETLAKGTRAQWSVSRGDPFSTMGTAAMLEELGPDKPGVNPATWKIFFHDGAEIGGKPRSVTLPVFRGLGWLPWGTRLDFAAASGGSALFQLTSGGRYMLVRTKPGGGTEIVEAMRELLPTGGAVFGANKGDPIAWMSESRLVVWFAGESPRVLAVLATQAEKWLGQPSREGVPVLLAGSDGALLRLVKIPALDKTTGAAPPPAETLLDGWTRTVNVRRDLGALRACTGKPGGWRFRVPRPRFAVQVDGVVEMGAPASYEVWLTGEEGCVAGLHGVLNRAGRRPGDRDEAIGFVRVGFVDKRAEGGAREVPANHVRKLECSLGVKP
jgi:hypothetical protein